MVNRKSSVEFNHSNSPDLDGYQGINSVNWFLSKLRLILLISDDNLLNICNMKIWMMNHDIFEIFFFVCINLFSFWFSQSASEHKSMRRFLKVLLQIAPGNPFRFRRCLLNCSWSHWPFAQGLFWAPILISICLDPEDTFPSALGKCQYRKNYPLLLYYKIISDSFASSQL